MYPWHLQVLGCGEKTGGKARDVLMSEIGIS